MNDNLSTRLKHGDPTALEEAMDRYAAYAAKIIAAYLNRMLPTEDMEEVLSDVFVSLWNSRERLTGEIKPYLAAIARNAARQRLRQSRFTETLPENWDIQDDAPPLEQCIESAEQASALRRAMDSMAPDDRNLLIRVYFLEQTVEEIAAITGQNASTLRVRLHRGRKKLRQILSERGILYD